MKNNLVLFAIAINLFIVSITTSYSQDQLEEYKQQFSQYHRQGKLKSALEALENAVAFATKKYGKNHNETIDIKLGQAKLYLEINNADKAQKICLEILALRNKTDNVTLATKTLLAKVKIKKKEYKQAEQILLAIVKVRREQLAQWKAKKNKVKDSLADFEDNLDASKQELARFYEIRGDNPKAESLILGTIKSSENSKRRELALIFNLGKLSSFYIRTNQLEKAVQINRRMIAVVTRHNGPQHVTNHTLMLELAGLYDRLKQYDNAKQYLFKALKFTETYRDGPFEKTGSRKLRTLWSLGSFYLQQKQYDHALDYYNKTLRLCKKVLGEKHPENHRIMTIIAVVYEKKKDYAKAERYLKESLQFSKDIKESNYTLASKKFLAELYALQGFKQKAISQLSDAIALSETTRGKNDSYTLSLKKELAKLSGKSAHSSK